MKRPGAGLVGNPRVFQALQSERLSRALSTVLRVSAAASSAIADRMERLSRGIGLARAQDVDRLERRLDELETEVRGHRQ